MIKNSSLMPVMTAENCIWANCGNAAWPHSVELFVEKRTEMHPDTKHTSSEDCPETATTEEKLILEHIFDKHTVNMH